MKSGVAFIVLLMTFGCRGGSKENQNKNTNATVTILLDSVEITILQYNSGYRYIFYPDSVKMTDVSRQEIVECEALIDHYIELYNQEAEKKYHNNEFEQQKIILADYGRQYMAVTTNKGERIIYANFFCDPESFEYREKDLVHVEDGGNCYFQFKIDLANKRISDFTENGLG